uniref:Uncharacterized protein n=1 Tax=Opuntia streptacantha TaxID=393608 RepID=A0A7C9DC65_OPUST
MASSNLPYMPPYKHHSMYSSNPAVISKSKGNPSDKTRYRMSSGSGPVRALSNMSTDSGPVDFLAWVSSWWMNSKTMKVMVKPLDASLRASWMNGLIWPWRGRDKNIA